MLPETEIICTEKLKLRLITPDVYRELFEICYDDEIIQYLGISIDDLALEKERYKKGIETYRISFMQFQILLDNTIIGDCSFHTWFKMHNRAEIGYAIRSEEFKGKGYIDLKDKNYKLFTQSFDIKIDPVVKEIKATLPLNPMSHKYVYLEVSKDIKPVSKSTLNFDLSKFIATK